LAVPFTVKDKQEPGAPFIVTVRPAQITTLSATPGIAVAGIPEHEKVDQVEEVFQFPFIREKNVAELPIRGNKSEQIIKKWE